MWLTHYSPSLVKPKEFLGVAREIFPNTRTARDLDSETLRFEDDD